MNTYDAIIVGAGPAGSTTAILLAQAGWKVALVEKQRFPRRKVCGECIAATNMPLFELLGIADEFNELAGTDLRQVAVMLGKRTIIADMPALSNSDSPWGRALSRERLDSLLLQRARDTGAEILQPWAVKEIEGKVGDYQCDIASVTCKETRHLKGRLIIAACGSWEPQPFMDHARVRNSSGDLFAFKANFQNSHLQPGLLPVLAFSGGYGGMVLDGSHNLTIACCVRRDALRACRAQFWRPTAGESVEAYLKASCSGVEHAL
ncbi:MAG TPA: FAD-dependent oxidoreductase, partial [Methylophilaceae bacterium]|nr:FAD-dependent oxidoreductase [Methylophilaceae bacterium]